MTSLASTPLALRLAGARPGEVLLDLLADDLVDRAEVLLDLRDLPGDPGHEVQRPRRRSTTSASGTKWKTCGFLGLPVAVDAADPLLQPGRVERDVEVDQSVAVRLQVDALTRGVGGQQHPDRLLGRVLGELRADVLAVLRSASNPG